MCKAVDRESFCVMSFCAVGGAKVCGMALADADQLHGHGLLRYEHIDGQV